MQVAREECRNVPRQVEQEECFNVPRQQCTPVTKQVNDDGDDDDNDRHHYEV